MLVVTNTDKVGEVYQHVVILVVHVLYLLLWVCGYGGVMQLIADIRHHQQPLMPQSAIYYAWYNPH